MMNNLRLTEGCLKQLQEWRSDWNKYLRDYIGLKLDSEQERIVESVQLNRRTAVSSGHARGKDYTAAALAILFSTLYRPSKVICTAPTGRQALKINMGEIANIHANSKKRLGGEVLNDQIKYYNFNTGKPITNWFVMAFKASDKATEDWTGFHSPNIFVIVTEATGIQDETFHAIEGLLTGQLSRLLIVFNPNRCSGEAYRATRSPLYAKHKLNCLDAPNVKAKRIIYPGQVDYEWVKEKLIMPGWATKIDVEMADPVNFLDFEFEEQWYRPSDLFRVKVLGEFPKEAENTLFPMSWIDAAVQHWHDRNGKGKGKLRIGADIAGMGVDTTCFAMARENVLEEFKVYSKSDHMATVGKLKMAMGPSPDTWAAVDTIGEGAGVFSRARELLMNVISAKFSNGAKGLTDKTGQRKFRNMRAYCHWALRDAIDPDLEGDFALPPDDELIEELATLTWDVTSDNEIFLVAKDEVKSALGRSPDKSDSAALLFWPLSRAMAYAASSQR